MSADPDFTLKRSLTLPLVTLYGLGNILGAGVYVLIGKVAGEAGYYAPLAFLLASVVAAITAFTFAELSSRYPVSAGEAIYVQEAFGYKQLSLLVGLLIVLTGIVSAATIAKGFVGYLHLFWQAPDWLIIVLLLAALCLVAIWGITESVATAAAFTVVEVAGLVLILIVTLPVAGGIPDTVPEISTAPEAIGWTGLVGGAFLAFYAYVGFEDMVNVAEEVEQPERNLPLAILTALGCATVLYVLVAINSLLVLTPQQLSASDAPMASVYAAATGSDPWLISIISMFAVVNGALIQIIMAARVCYGLARQGWLPTSIGSVHPKTRTPLNATIVITGIILVAALWLPIETLANSTTTLLLVVFSLVNVALVRVKLKRQPTENIFEVPLAVPLVGCAACVGFLLAQAGTLLTQ